MGASYSCFPLSPPSICSHLAGLYRFIALGAKELMVQVWQFELNSSFVDTFQFDLKKLVLSAVASAMPLVLLMSL